MLVELAELCVFGLFGFVVFVLAFRGLYGVCVVKDCYALIDAFGEVVSVVVRWCDQF